MDVSKNALKTVGLTKSYFGNRVVRDVNMTVRRGEIYGLVGRNGAGKSTLMKLICGFVIPTSGSVEVLGVRVKPGETHPRLGSLIEKPGAYEAMSGRDNLMCRALALGLVDPDAEVDRVLELVGLGEAGADRVNTYSLGMKQRLGIAFALMGTPDVLVLDEPFNGVDIEGTRALRQLIVSLNERNGVTVLISSHVIDQLARCVTRYGVMRAGRLVCEKTVDDIERECADCLCVRCSNAERAVAVLEDAFPRAGVSLCANDEIRLDAGVPTGEVATTLVGAGLEVEELYVRECDIEGYFAELMGDGGARTRARPDESRG